MRVERLKVGLLETNCYIVYHNEGCLIVDPGDEYKKIKKVTEGYEIEGILITHYHFDHVGALSEFLKNDCYVVFSFKTLGKQKTKNFIFDVVLNKGHKEDCVSFVFDDFIFTGDFIFKEGIGRVDLPGGDYEVMKASLENFKKLNKNYTIYPGHGLQTTYEHEIKYNPYLN